MKHERYKSTLIRDCIYTVWFQAGGLAVDSLHSQWFCKGPDRCTVSEFMMLTILTHIQGAMQIRTTGKLAWNDSRQSSHWGKLEPEKMQGWYKQIRNIYIKQTAETRRKILLWYSREMQKMRRSNGEAEPEMVLTADKYLDNAAIWEMSDDEGGMYSYRVRLWFAQEIILTGRRGRLLC